jgi:single-strand DNA-binding protein
MSATLNRVMLIGHLGRDPEIHNTEGGKQLASLSLATSDRWTDRQSGEKKERTEWHRVVVLREPLVEILQKYARKGAKIYVEGSQRTRKWKDRDGNDRWTIETVVSWIDDRVLLLDRRQAETESDHAPKASPPDDDIPF